MAIDQKSDDLIAGPKGAAKQMDHSCATRDNREIPSLHGLRAASILFVIVAHGLGFSHYPSWIKFFFLHGELGVRIFFVISGFLITTLLLRERGQYGDVSLRLFYLRRILRIFPAFYLFAGLIVFMWSRGLIVLPPGNILLMVTYTMNFASNGTWVTGHLWSLSVEEQFYLLWPLAVKFAPRQMWVGISIMTVFAGIAIRALYAMTGVQLIDPALRDATPFVAGPIAMGCLLGIYPPGLPVWKRALTAIRGIRLLGVITLILFLDSLDLGTANRFIALVTNSLLTVLVARFVVVPTDSFGRVLNSRPMILLGKLSYSLYLWQQLFFDPFSSWIVSRFPLNVLGTLSAAGVSYLLVERPLVKYRKLYRR